MNTNTDWARLARAAGRCLAVADDLDFDARVMAGLRGGIQQARYIRADEDAYRKLAAQADSKARELHAVEPPCGDLCYFYNDPSMPMHCELPKGHAGDHADESYNCQWSGKGVPDGR